MTPAQRTAILAVIDSDAEIKGELCNSRGKMCISGGLAHAAGVNKNVIRGAIYLAEEQEAMVDSKFGFHPGDLAELVECNDRYNDRAERQEALKDLVLSWEIGEE